MNPWFRMYERTLDNPKVQRLSGDAFKGWINILCLSCRNDGELPSLADTAFALRMTEKQTTALLETLQEADLLDGNKPHDWDALQYKSDVSKDRVKRHRQRKRNGECNVTPTVTETPPDTDTDTDTEKSPPLKGAPPDSDDGLDIPAAFDRTDEGEAVRLWNETAERFGLPAVQILNTDRRKKLRLRLQECGGIEGWKAAMEKVAGSAFLRGKNDRDWRADFDFVLQKKSFTKLMEGAYGGSSGGTNGKPGGGVDSAGIDAAILGAIAGELAGDGDISGGH